MNKMFTFFSLIYISNPVYFLTYDLFTVKELDDSNFQMQTGIHNIESLFFLNMI